jgi:type II pantothenate kinase
VTEQAPQGAVGIDVGATLAKLAIRGPDGEVRFSFTPAGDLGTLAEHVAASAPGPVGLTGAGGSELSRTLPRDATVVNEFAAWGAGADELLRREKAGPGERYLLVSVGTGTSVMLADGMAVQRVGGTALGGGTLVGLATALLATKSFAELAELAIQGDRRRFDLMVSDLYRAGEIALSGDLTASNLGKLAEQHGKAAGCDGYRADLAHSLMALVGENVALVCAGLAAALRVRRVVFGGSTLRANPALTEILDAITRATGSQVQFLKNGEFAGALGALLLAES